MSAFEMTTMMHLLPTFGTVIIIVTGLKWALYWTHKGGRF
jgi:hypothetical protein